MILALREGASDWRIKKMNKKIIVGICTIITAIAVAVSAYFDDDESTKIDVAATGSQIIEGGTMIKYGLIDSGEAATEDAATTEATE